MIIRTITSSNFCIRLLANVALLIVELTGDRIAAKYVLPVKVGALVDNAVHGLIGALIWLIVIDYRLEVLLPGLFEVVTCGAFACFIDVDHFLEAKSIYLKDAMHLSRRPLFHSTSLLATAWVVLIFVAIWTGSTTVMRFSWIFLTAGLSHHLRDGIRRGLWLYPFGSTNPLPYWCYIMSTALLPHLVRLCSSYAQSSEVISKYQHVLEV